jgi:hypothetical protein
LANSAPEIPSSTYTCSSATIQPFDLAYARAWSICRATDFCSSATPICSVLLRATVSLVYHLDRRQLCGCNKLQHAAGRDPEPIGDRRSAEKFSGPDCNHVVLLPGTGISHTSESHLPANQGNDLLAASPIIEGDGPPRRFPVVGVVLGLGALIAGVAVFQGIASRPEPAPFVPYAPEVVSPRPAPAKPTCSIDGISEAAWLPPVSGDRPHVQVKLAKVTRPVAITDVLRRCLQQIVDTGQIAQAIVAVALQPDGRPARLADGSEGLVFVPFEKRYVPTKQYRQPAVAPAVSPRTAPAPSTRSAPSAPPGATAQCRDGTYSHAASRRGACSRHGGVSRWLSLEAVRGGAR